MLWMKNMDLPKPKCTGQMVMALAMMAGFFVALYFLVTHEIPGANHDVIITLLGAFVLSFGNVISYYFGSSIGSRNKEETLSSTVKNLTPSVDQPIDPKV
jgi:formate/nitrite transporter FocA (FNT family)